MSILASFFDPSNNGFDGDDYVRIGAIIAVTTVLAGLFWRRVGGRWAWRKIRGVVDDAGENYVERIVKRENGILLDEVRELTKLIQPGANSGESLADNNRLTAWLVDVIEVVAARLNLTSDDLPPKPDVRHNARTRSTDT